MRLNSLPIHLTHGCASDYTVGCFEAAHRRAEADALSLLGQITRVVHQRKRADDAEASVDCQGGTGLRWHRVKSLIKTLIKRVQDHTRKSAEGHRCGQPHRTAGKLAPSSGRVTALAGAQGQRCVGPLMPWTRASQTMPFTAVKMCVHAATKAYAEAPRVRGAATAGVGGTPAQCVFQKAHRTLRIPHFQNQERI